MAESVLLADPHKITPNPENPRLIFRADELDALEKSIREQGVLVPLAVYRQGTQFVLLDGERRWRCATRLGLGHVPVIVQPKPDRLTNIMMMFAIHNARKDWDPLPTAMKLHDLEGEFTRRNGRTPTEAELASLASISRGEVRRLKMLLRLPQSYRDELMGELEKPDSKRRITVDQVLEATRAADLVTKRGVIAPDEEDSLRRALVDKFRAGLTKNTVAPRKLARVARAVERGDVPQSAARAAISRLITDADYSVDQAYEDTVERVDLEHTTAQLAERVERRLLSLVRTKVASG